MSAHQEIDIVARRVLNQYQWQARYLEGKPTEYLQDLQHRAEQERFNETFSICTAAEINRAACVMILETRGITTKAAKGGKR